MMKQTNPVFESIDKDKLRRMLAIREEYNTGKLTLEEARRRMRDEVGKVSPEEFAAAEQLVKDEDPDECRAWPKVPICRRYFSPISLMALIMAGIWLRG